MAFPSPAERRAHDTTAKHARVAIVEWRPPATIAWDAAAEEGMGGILRHSSQNHNDDPSDHHNSNHHNPRQKVVRFDEDSNVHVESATSAWWKSEAAPGDAQGFLSSSSSSPSSAPPTAGSSPSSLLSETSPSKAQIWYSGMEIRRMKQATVPLLRRVDSRTRIPNSLEQWTADQLVTTQALAHDRGNESRRERGRRRRPTRHTSLHGTYTDRAPTGDEDESEGADADDRWVSIRGLEFGTREGQERRSRTLAFQSMLLRAQQHFKQEMMTKNAEIIHAPLERQDEPEATRATAATNSILSPTEGAAISSAFAATDENDKVNFHEQGLAPVDSEAALAALSRHHSQEAVVRALNLAIEDAAFVCLQEEQDLWQQRRQQDLKSRRSSLLTGSTAHAENDDTPPLIWVSKQGLKTFRKVLRKVVPLRALATVFQQHRHRIKMMSTGSSSKAVISSTLGERRLRLDTESTATWVVA